MEERTRNLSVPLSLSEDSKTKSIPVLEPAAGAHVPDQEPQWVSGLKLLPIVIAVTIGSFLMLLDISIIVTATPVITSHFHSLQDVGWYGAAYELASAVLQPLTGKFYSNFDPKWTFLAFFALFEVGSLICAVATSSKMFIIGRAVAGLGTSGILNGAFTIIAGCVPMHKRPALIGFVSGVSQLGLVAGPLIGGALTQYVNWRWCFYINLPIGGLLAVLLIFSHVPDPLPKPPFRTALRTLPPKLDLWGFVFFAGAALQLLLALDYGGTTFRWNSATIIGLFCGGGGTFLVFLGWEYHKGDEAMIAFSMVKQKIVWSSCLAYGLFMAQLVCVAYYLPIYFQGVKGASPTMSGVYFLPIVLSHVLFAITSGILLGKLGYYLPFALIGSALVAIGNGLLATLLPETSTGKWIGYQIISGAGRGLALQIPIIAVQNTLAPTQIPDAMAILMFSQSFIVALFLSFSDTIFTNSLKTLIPEYAPSIDPQVVINAGATGFRSLFEGDNLVGILVAYAKSIDRELYLTAGAAVGCFAASWFMGFKDIRKKDEGSKA
ncbi:hypothetical protein MFRU_007g02930 [Monilinia fructicola]|nr:hypothetical protein MFRU_007g02930 [Monilinia fructicola]